jgi:hypothetical protein
VDVADAVDAVNEVAIRLADVPLIRPPDPINAERVRVLHIPGNRSMPAFQQQLVSLSILLIDGLNKALLERVGAPRAGGQLNRLSSWIGEARAVGESEGRDALGGLYAIQALRSKMGAHRAHSELADALRRAEIEVDELPAGLRRLIVGACEALDRLYDELAQIEASKS